MLRMPPFDVVSPRTAAEAVAARAADARSLYVAGGTDLLPNLKLGLHAPSTLVDLMRVDELTGISHVPEGLRIGATTRLSEVADGAEVREHAPALARAARLVAGPQHRNMGTLGGNVLLDTRCLFYNQEAAWRAAIGFCLKKDGVHCHVSGSPKGCVAAQSSDTVPVLTVLGASVEIVGPDGPAVVALADLFGKDGRFDEVHRMPSSALLTAVVVPAASDNRVATYRKVRARGAVDFPQVGIAVAATRRDGALEDVAVVVGAMLPAPRIVRFPDVRVSDNAAVDEIVARVQRQCRPMTSVHGEPEWRRHMAGIETRRALAELAAG
jgi:4-hydroxybenzoyl-CoA reductase subunit beta